VKNSESQLKDLQAVEANYKIKIIPVRLATVEEINQLLPGDLADCGRSFHYRQ